MKHFLLRFLPVIFLFAVWLFFAGPYFFEKKVPYPSDFQVSFFTPWNAYADFAGPVKNNALSDVVDQLFPWKHFTITQLKHGELPLWNPYTFSGTPHLANYQSAVFSPFTLLFFVLPFLDAWSMLILLQPLFAGLFLYLFLRTIKTTELAAVFGAVAYMFCGFMTVWMAYGTLSMAVAFLPLCLFAIERYVASVKKWYLFLLAGSIAVSFLSGHFQMSLYVALFVFAYLLFAAWQSKKRIVFVSLLTAYVVGVLISLVQILPTLFLYQESVRSGLFSNSEGIPWYYLVTAFAPDFFGNPVTRNDWIGHYAEWASFIGIVPFLFALVALFLHKERKQMLFFAVAALVSLLLALDSPLQQVIAAIHLPVFSTSIPSRVIVLFSFSAIVLSAFGLDMLRSVTFRQLLRPIGVAAALIVGVWLVALFAPVIPAEHKSAALRNLVLPTGFFGVACLLMFFSFVRKKRLVVLAGVCLLLLVTGDSLRFATKWMPFGHRSLVFPTVPVISAMQKEVGQGRVYGDFGSYIDTYYRIPSIEGYDPLYSRRYGELLESAKTGKFTQAVRSLATLDERGKYTQRVLDLLGVTVIYQPISHSNAAFAFPVWDHPENFPTLFRDENFALFGNASALPRVKVFTQYEVIPDDKRLVERLFAHDFDYRTVLLLEENPGFEQKKDATTSAEILSYEPNEVIVSTTSDVPGLLFLSDSYYPAWQVTVNGKSEHIFVADHALRAVKIPKGKATVVFSYKGLF